MSSEITQTVLVVDAQGGGLGKQLITSMRKKAINAHIIACGTNSTATMAMLKAGADEVATGENSICVASKRASIIVGPIGLVITDAMLGEITPKIALSIARSKATRIFIPFSNCDNYIVGVSNYSLGTLIEEAVSKLKELCQ